MADDRQTLVGKWRVWVKDWVWEYEFFPNGTLTWRDTGSGEKGAGQWAMSSTLVNFWWFNSATRESWQRPLSTGRNKKTWYQSSYFAGPYQIEKLTEPDSPKPPHVDPVGNFDIVDVIVRYQGVGDNPRPLPDFDVFPDTMLRQYNERTLKRKLVRIGRATTTIRGESAAFIAKDLSTIEASFKGQTRGGIFIYGSSSGGRNALDLAIALEGKQLPLVYIAVIDAAVFPNEVTNKPDSSANGGTPMFAPSAAITTGVRENFFQRVGNHTEHTARHGLLFFSKMAGHEVHGDIAGFTRQDLTKAIENQNPPDDDSAHRMMITEATPLVRARLKTWLDVQQPLR